MILCAFALAVAANVVLADPAPGSDDARTASITLMVRSDAGEPQPGVRVVALPLEARLEMLAHEPKLAGLALANAITDKSGHVRMTGLPAGQVFFLVYADDAAHPQATAMYTLEAGKETAIDEVRIEKRSVISVTVAVPREIEPSLQLWNVQLDSIDLALPSIEAPLTATGAVFRDVPPGKWRVSAGGRLKNGFALYVGETVVDVAAGVDRAVTLVVTDGLFRGRITHRGKPVQGSINLMPVDRTSRRRHVVSYLAADGTFQVLLERPGEYSMYLQELPSRRGARLDRFVSFRDPAERLEIELPTGEIRGTAHDSSGFVTATRVGMDGEGETSAGALIRPDGTFQIDFLAAGTWRVSVEKDDDPPVTVTLVDGEVRQVVLNDQRRPHVTPP